LSSYGNLDADSSHKSQKSISLCSAEVPELCAMPNNEERLFIVTASNSDAQRHVEHSISNPIDAELCKKYFDKTFLDGVATSSDDGHFYAWGAVPGKRNAPNWEQMKPGDHVLVYQNGIYRYWTRVIAKHRNMEFAKALWGSDPDGQTWELMYFVQPSTPLRIPAKTIADLLPGQYMGFTPIALDRLDRIATDYGSISKFIEERMVQGGAGKYFIFRSNEDSDWADEDGASYHYGNTVPNYTAVLPGVQVLIDRRFPEGKKIVGVGTVGEITEGPATLKATKTFRASFETYRSMKPPRILTPEDESELESLPGFNGQHSIRPITKELFERLAQPPRAWIFQCNPQLYNIRGALKSLKSDTSLVSRYQDEILLGDRVYLWESGKEAGIVGLGEVIDKPSSRLAPPESASFQIDSEKFKGERVRALVRFLGRIDPAISRDQILSIPALSDLSILKQAQGTNFAVTPAEAEVIEDLLLQRREPRRPMEPNDQSGRSKYAQLCDETFLPEIFFRDCERLLEKHKQIILQGAPGTGKTFVAQKLASWWADGSEHTRIIQFHESYGYEDFVYGIKPQYNPETDQTLFRPVAGVFLKFCEAVAKDSNPSARYVLVIDEVNRAKISRVFGELLYLLEYRDRSVTLQSGEEFSIPKNLYIVGTMNTSDKSIALVDYALRRRFAFVMLHPVEGDKSVVLRKWLDANGVANASDVERLFVALNKLVATKDEALVIGHSYFMSDETIEKKRLAKEELEFIWRYRIMPLVAEYEYELTTAQVAEKYGLAAVSRLAGLK
jgi:hypothetical protein